MEIMGKSRPRFSEVIRRREWNIFSKGKTEGHAEGKAEGRVEGRAEGRDEIQARWENWLELKTRAEQAGKDFDVPPPSLT